MMRRLARWPLIATMLTAACCLLATSVRAEKIPLSQKHLTDLATNIVVGKVNAVYTRDSKNANYHVTHYVAEVAVEKTEKGEGLKPGGLVYVRYWTQGWIGAGNPPPGTNGHSGMGGVGDQVRLYLVNKGYDGGGHVTDGGYNVVFRDGCEVLPKPEPKKSVTGAKAPDAKPFASSAKE